MIFYKGTFIIPEMKMVFFDIDSHNKEYMEKHFPDASYLSTPLLEITNITEEMSKTEIISIFTTSKVTAETLDKFPNLKLIALRSVGFSHVDLDYCKTRGIRVTNTPHYGDHTVAEFAFGLLLAVTRKIKLANEDFERGSVNLGNYTGMELFCKTVGVIGTGAIGKQFIRIAKGFAMNVIGYDIYPDKNLNIEYTDLEDLCARSDAISIHAPLTKDNFHLIDKQKFEKMKKGVIIINTARGELIDSLALYEALLNKTVSGAGLDVIESEEITAHDDDYVGAIDSIDKQALKDYMLTQKLLKIPNVIITPHIAYDTCDAIQRILDMTVHNINGFIYKSEACYVV